MFLTRALSGSQVLAAGMSLFSGLGTYCVKQWPKHLLCKQPLDMRWAQS